MQKERLQKTNPFSGLYSHEHSPTRVTYHFFHWKKGTPFAENQGIYNRLTWWEQVDNGKQLTRNRKFLTVAPLAKDSSSVPNTPLEGRHSSKTSNP
ncbi:hypothetical protein Fmac_015774 [Flemingia macrophylla]|uniref:Uncharacterized protein n=1 Tax=Flemingia macrophylla TaxID=520843 RepID=A0ABD1MFN2_9FABA